MFDYLWSDESRTTVIRVDQVGNVVAFFYGDEGYGEAVSKVSGVAGEITKAKPVTEEEARQCRHELLVASDWTQVADAPVDQAAWATYRQALRDIPEQAGFPQDIQWPDPPI